MTQFSVETLTVLIYVLVFRHFRNLGALSPPLVRSRDAFIAAGIGTLIGGLVLSVVDDRDRAATARILRRVRPCRSATAATSSTSSWWTSAGSTRWAKSPCSPRPPSASARCCGWRPPSSRRASAPASRDLADLSHGRALPAAAAAAVLAVPAAARPQRAGRRVRRRAGRRGGIRALPHRLRRRARAARAAGQPADAARRRPADRPAQRHTGRWSAANRS